MGFSAFGAIGAAVGSLLTNKLFGNKSGSSWDYDEARQSMQLQKELYDYKYQKELDAMNSAHTREIADLKNAGLNPILSATGGSGLNSPSGAMPDISSVNSAITTARQSDRALRMNSMLSLLDAGIRAEANKINKKSAEASMISAEAAADQAKASLVNSEQNAINTGSMVQERLFKMGNLDADTRKKLAEINLVNSQMFLNSAYASKANTDAYVASQMLPYQQALSEAEAKYKREILPADIRTRMTSGGVPAVAIEVARRLEDAVTPARNWMLQNAKQNVQSAKDLYDLPSGQMFNLFKRYNTVRKFMNNK